MEERLYSNVNILHLNGGLDGSSSKSYDNSSDSICSQEPSQRDSPRVFVRKLKWYIIDQDNKLIKVYSFLTEVAAIVTSIIYA